MSAHPDSPSGPRVRSSGPLPPLLVGLATALVYLPALKNGFVDWDDQVSILTNTHFRGLGPGELRWMFTTFHLGPYQPLAWMSLGFDYLLWGLRPAGYHLTSLLLHAASAVVLYLLAEALLVGAPAGDRQDPDFRKGEAAHAGASSGAARVGAAAAALLFSLHPLRVESVAWATERRDVLSGLFFLLAAFAYVRAGRATAGSVALYVCSLLSKGTALAFPLVLLLLDFYPLRRFGWGNRPEGRGRVFAEKAPYLIAALLAGAVALIGQHQAHALRGLDQMGIAGRLGMAAYAAVFYVAKTIIPTGLSPLYQLPSALGALRAELVACGALVLGATALLGLARHRFPAWAVAWMSYLLLLAPVSGLVRVGDQIAADRYSYLASIPLAILAGVGIARIVSRGAGKTATGIRPGNHPLVLAGLLVWLGVLSVLTVGQIAVWRDSLSLWGRAVRLDPSSPKARYSLGFAYFRAGRIAEATGEYREAIRLEPGHLEAHTNLGMILAEQGDLEGARSEFEAAESSSPSDATVQYDLGLVARLQGNMQESEARFLRALTLRPSMETARINLAQIYHESGRLENARRLLLEGLALSPDSVRLREALAAVESR